MVEETRYCKCDWNVNVASKLYLQTFTGKVCEDVIIKSLQWINKF